ncbi:MAG: 50S ribosomal protein L10 [Sedimentisphaerales bacterium]|nr:50S ribosomal protein L10 [Sedimentisphaerales bacterium]
MSKFVKGLIQHELEKKITQGNARDFIILSLMGISGTENNELRSRLKSKGIKLSVVRNSLFKKALKNNGMDEAVKLFEGPCAIAYGGDSIVDIAKEIVDCSKKIKVLQIKNAFLEGAALDEKDAVELSKMPNRAELLGQVLVLVMSPARKIAGCVMGPGGIIAGCIKALADKKEKEAA